MSDRPLLDPIGFEALAYGVFSTASDTDTGRASLLDAYNSYQWTDEAKAKKTLEYYGQQLKFKNEDQSSYGDNIAEISPVKLRNIQVPEDDDSLQSLFSNYEELNLAYLNKPDLEPEYAVARIQMIEDVKAYASRERRKANKQGLEEDIGETGAAVVDFGNRMGQGFLAGVEPIINSGVNVFTDGYELNSHITEYTDPSRDGKFISNLATGVGSVGGSFAAGGVAGIAGVTANAVSQGTDATGTRYQDTLRKTGDVSKARTAGAVEAGSQALQVVGERLVFGKIAAKVPTQIGKSAAAEAGAEGGGQIISNVAENIETNEPAFNDIGRGAAEAAFLGGALGGGAVGASKVKIGRANTNDRKSEIVQSGEPITPVTKQVVGAIQPAEATDVIPSEEGFDFVPSESITDETDTPRVIDPELDVEKGIILPKGETAFETDDGSQYIQSNEGRYSRVGDLAHDFTFFMSPDTAQVVASAIDNGEQVTLNKDNIPVIERVNEAGEKSFEEIPVSLTPTEDSYTLPLSEERSPSPTERVRPVGPIQRVKAINLDRSLGAAGRVQGELKESKLSQTMRFGDVAPGLQAIGEEGIFYEPFVLVEGAREAGDIVKGGIENAVNAFNDPTTNPKLKGAINTALLNYFNRQEGQAAEAGDTDRLEKILAYERQHVPDLSAQRTEIAQVMNTFKGLFKSKVGEVFTRAYEGAVTQVAKEEGATPQEVAQADNTIEQSKRAIETATKDVERQSAIDAEFISPEDRDVAVVVEDIENEAQEKLDSDLASIEAETEELLRTVETVEKKAVRQKRKDIQVLEGAVAKDNEALVNALQEAADFKEATDEELNSIGEAVKKAIEAATSKASTEVTKAVKEERKLRAESQKSAVEKATERVDKATEAFETKRKSAAEQIKKLRLKIRALEAEGKSTIDEEIRATKIEEAVTKSAQRVVDAKENMRLVEEEISAVTEESQQTEELLKELESGVQVQVRPQGRKRYVSIKTKRSGMDITKLFRRGEASGPLSALATSVNELAGTIKTSLGGKVKSSEKISALAKRISENTDALQKARTRDPVSESEKKRISAAKQRLQDLDSAKQDATLESRIPAARREKYKKFKVQQASAKKGRKSDSPELKEAKDRLQKAEAAKARAEKLSQKNQQAKKKATREATQQSAVEKRIAELEALLAAGNLTPSHAAQIKGEILELKGEFERTPGIRYALSNMWAANMINGYVIGPLAVIAATVGIVTIPTALAVGDVASTLKNRGISKLKSGAFVKGVADPSAWYRGALLAKVAFTSGKRLSNILKRSDVALSDLSKVSAKPHEEFIGEFYDHTKMLNFSDAETAVQKFYVGLAKTAGILTLPAMRILAASEAMVYSVLHSGFDRATAAHSINQLKAKGVEYGDLTTKEVGRRPPTDQELAQYMYNPRENWENSVKYAADQAARLRVTGIEVNKNRELLDAVERYQSILPRQIQVSAYKQAAQLVGNGPAQGILGVVSDGVNAMVEIMGEKSPPLKSLKILTMFANSIAQFTNTKLAWTPFGIVDSLTGRTDFEKMLIRSQATTGTMAGVAVLSILHAWNDEEDGEPPFDVVSLDGGYTYTFKIGDTYINTADTPLALWAYGLGVARDKMKKGEDPDPVLTTIAMQSSFTAVAAMVGGVKNSMQMLQGVSNIIDAFSAAAKGNPDAQPLLVRSIMNPLKGFIPGASMLRTAVRFFDNPVAARKDIASAIVEGIPGIQSEFGLPSLNAFGEVMSPGKDDPDLNIHRIFSTKPSDVDLRWLVDNGYTTPSVSRMPLPKSVKDYANYLNEFGSEESVETDFRLKHEAFRAAAPELRELVREYRETYSYSARDPEIQKSLNKAFNRIVAEHAVALLDR